MPKGTDVQVGFFCPQSKQTYIPGGERVSHCCSIAVKGRPRFGAAHWGGDAHALLAGFDLSFSKIFCDCCFVARAAILAESAQEIYRRWQEEGVVANGLVSL